MQFLSYLARGISLGSVYALIALGYTMVYGIAKMLNFAHGDVIMVGGYVVFFTFCKGGLHPILAIILAMGICMILGITIERIAYRPLRGASSLSVLITAIGVSYFLQNGAMLMWKSDPKSFTSVVKLKPLVLFDGQLQISAESIVTILVSVVIMVVLIWFVQYTKPGHAMQAVSEDRGAAQLMGINVNGIISMTFAIGSALAAVAGALLLSSYPTLIPTTGAMPGIKAFVAAVFGPCKRLCDVRLRILQQVARRESGDGQNRHCKRDGQSHGQCKFSLHRCFLLFSDAQEGVLNALLKGVVR